MQNIKYSVWSLTYISFIMDFFSFGYGLGRVNTAWIYYSLLFPLTRCPAKLGNDLKCFFFFFECVWNVELCLLAAILSQKFARSQYLALAILIVYLLWIWNQIYYRTYHEQLQQQHQQKQHVLLGLWFPGAWDTADVPSFCDCCLFLISATSVPKWL